MTRHIQPQVAVFKVDASCNARVGPKWGPDWQGYLALMLTVDQNFSFGVLDACVPLIGRSLHVDIASIRRSILASELCDSCHDYQQCRIAPSRLVCWKEAALV
jgi:hypothetical protein